MPASKRLRERIRSHIVLRWLRLVDEAAWLEEAIRSAPPGTFTDRERSEALHGLGNDVWNGLQNFRPRLPQSRLTRGSRT